MKKRSLIQDMSDNGYDVKLYTSSEYLNGVNQEAVANTAWTEIQNIRQSSIL